MGAGKGTAERKTERSGPKFRKSGGAEQSVEREVAEQERSGEGERAESAARSPLQSNISLTS